MIHLTKHKDEYLRPLSETCDIIPSLLCQSNPDEWGNEPLIPGQPLN